MGIDAAVGTINEQYAQSVYGIIADAMEKSRSSGNPIMPNDLHPLFKQSLAKYETAQADITEKWLEILQSGDGIAHELEKLGNFYAVITALPELNKLEREVEKKRKEETEAKDRYDRAIQQR